MNELRIRDNELDVFNEAAFKRLRPYLDLLTKHYGHIGSLKNCSDIAKRFDEQVKRYIKTFSDEDFAKISALIREIRTENYTDTLKDLVRAKADALTIAILSLAPLPSNFISNAQVSMMNDPRFKNDELLAYLGTLRFVNIFRGFMILPIWLKRYDNEDFTKKFGNVLFQSAEGNANTNENDKINRSTIEVFATHIPELKIKNSNNKQLSIDEIITKESAANVKVFKYDKKIRLNITIEDLVKKDLEGLVETPDVVVINLLPGLTEYFTQIVERISVLEGIYYDLKGIVLVRTKSNAISPTVMVFDEEFQFWNIFDPTGVLSMPRQFARKYSNQHGTHFIYCKKMKSN